MDFLHIFCFLFIEIGSIDERIYLFSTFDDESTENFDCLSIESTRFCRRPDKSIRLKRIFDQISCRSNGGDFLRIGELLSNSNSTSIEHFPFDEPNDNEFVCFCSNSNQFGLNCEYELPFGETFGETIEYQRDIRERNLVETRLNQTFICYETLKCDSGAMCLDWREICDGIPQCSVGIDENHCDYLELNRCDTNEYRCTNGMCIPEENYLDGHFDCFDWSDELPLKPSRLCSTESVSSICDDHICPPNFYSCGDGQCIEQRFPFLTTSPHLQCSNLRNLFGICETDPWIIFLTQPNGICLDEYFPLTLPTNRTDDDICIEHLRCSFIAGRSQHCSCSSRLTCDENLRKYCPLREIFYPRRNFFSPFYSTIYNRIRDSRNLQPDWILINGTIECHRQWVTVQNRRIRFPSDFNVKRLINDEFCSKIEKNLSSKCFNANESIDLCFEGNSCRSKTRIRDGFLDCLNERDESLFSSQLVKTSCEQNRRFRLFCSEDEPTCLNLMNVADEKRHCSNEFDEFWFGKYRKLSEIRCHERNQDECFLLRNYIEDSSKNIEKKISDENQIPFRYFCDSFWHFGSGEDENTFECRQQWKCFDDLFQCSTGQCIDPNWVNDDDFEWDCPDGSDETIKSSWIFDYLRRSKSTSIDFDRCHPERSLICLAANSSERLWICLDQKRISDGKIDCLGAFDERHQLKHCSQMTYLGNDFYCSSTNSCIPFYYHCQDSTARCPNLVDDHLWCSRTNQTNEFCSSKDDFICFDGQCKPHSRCDKISECLQGEDEFFCDYRSVQSHYLRNYRKEKWHDFSLNNRMLDVSSFPSNVNLISSTSATPPKKKIVSFRSNFIGNSSSFECHRGVAIVYRPNQSIVCFCPDQYYGDRCSFHSDRISLLLQWNFSSSIYSNDIDSSVQLRCWIFFMFDEEILSFRSIYLHPIVEKTRLKKFFFTFVYPRTFRFVQNRFKQNLSRFIVENQQNFSIRIEIYEIRPMRKVRLIYLWIYRIFFDFLPNFRLSKILRLKIVRSNENPCSISSCSNPNEFCQPILNENHRFVCLCREGFYGTNCSMKNKFCSKKFCGNSSLTFCQSNLQLSSTGKPFCICSSNYFGFRCQFQNGFLSNKSMFERWNMFNILSTRSTDLFVFEEIFWRIL